MGDARGSNAKDAISAHRVAAEWAERARKARLDLREALRSGDLSLDQVIETSRTEDLIGRVKLLWVLESLPGAGKVATRRRLDALGMDGSWPLSRFTEEQHKVLVDAFTPQAAFDGGDGSGPVDDALHQPEP